MKQVSRGKELRGKDQPWDGLHIQEGEKKDAKDKKMSKTGLNSKDGPPKL